MDSDKRNKATSINATKKRIQKEFNDKNLFSWITKGKEIENYLSIKAISSALGIHIEKQCGIYELFPKYIEPHYMNFTGNKVKFANQIKMYIDTENILDLSSRIHQLYEVIKAWNK